MPGEHAVGPGALICLGICLLASVTDLRSRRIPNWLTYPSTLVAAALAASPFGVGVGAAAGGFALLFGGFLLLGLFDIVGMGDVKLLGAIGALLGWPLAYSVLVDVLLAGGALALLSALRAGSLTTVLANIGDLARPGSAARRGFAEDDGSLHPMPYALAILAGTTYAIATAPLGLPNVP